MLLSSCGPPTLAELEGCSFSSVSEFEEAISCSDHFRVFPHWGGDPPVIETADEAVEVAASLLHPSQPGDKAVEAGGIWLLVDGADFAFAAMESVGVDWRMLGILIPSYREGGVSGCPTAMDK